MHNLPYTYDLSLKKLLLTNFPALMKLSLYNTVDLIQSFEQVVMQW